MPRAVRALLLVLASCSAEAAVAGPNDLVVMLGYRSEADPYNIQVGAGLLVHHAGDSAIVVTALHNLPERDRSRPTFRDEQVFVEFYSEAGEDRLARVVAEDPSLDLAALEVRTGASSEPFEASREVLQPPGADVVAEHGAFALGYPNRRRWHRNQEPEPILEKLVENGHVYYRFESSVTYDGMSGGGLFSEHGALLGMVQTLSASDRGARALSIESIAKRLADWGLSFSLTESADVLRSASRRVLEDLGIASAAGVRQSVEGTRIDYNVLHLFWSAGLAGEVAEALAALVRRGERSFAAELFERLSVSCIRAGEHSADASANQRKLAEAVVARLAPAIELAGGCEREAYTWVRGLSQAGLDPDLIVPGSYYASEALLALAMRARSGPVVRALLDSGASPHPYQDLSGTEYPETRFLDPLGFIDSEFVGEEKDALWQAFLTAGVVVAPRYRRGIKKELPESPDLAASDSDPICRQATARDAFDWCDHLRQLSPAVSFDIGHQECPGGYCATRLTHTLFIANDRAWLMSAQRDGGHIEPVVVEVPRAPGQWYAYAHRRNYRCIPRDDGFEPSSCWRRYSAAPGSARVKPRDLASASPSVEKSHSILDSIEVEGISLATPLSEALAALEAAGYTSTTAEAEGSTRDQLTVRDYSIQQDGGLKVVKVIALNESLRALFFGFFGESSEIDFGLPPLDPSDLLYHAVDGDEEWRQVQAVEASPVGRSYLLVREESASYTPIDVALLRRAVYENPAERAFFGRWLLEWLGGLESRATSERPCLDQFAHIRGHPEPECLTLDERASQHLDEVAGGSSVRRLPGGVLYEVLAAGDGPQPSPNTHNRAYIRFHYLDGLKSGESINNLSGTLQQIRWDEIREAIAGMRQGARWRLFVPPGTGSNQTPYLQITEISLETVRTTP